MQNTVLQHDLFDKHAQLLSASDVCKQVVSKQLTVPSLQEICQDLYLPLMQVKTGCAWDNTSW